MKATKLIAAAFVFAAAGSAFAADAPVAAAPAAGTAVAAAAAAAAPVDVAARNTNLPSVTIGATSSATSREAVRAEAVEFVKNHKTAFAIQLEQYKN